MNNERRIYALEQKIENLKMELSQPRKSNAYKNLIMKELPKFEKELQELKAEKAEEIVAILNENAKISAKNKIMKNEIKNEIECENCVNSDCELFIVEDNNIPNQDRQICATCAEEIFENIINNSSHKNVRKFTADFIAANMNWDAMVNEFDNDLKTRWIYMLADRFSN